MCLDICTETCINMCMDMYIEARVDMCIDICTETCIDMCMNMCIDMYIGAVPMVACGRAWRTAPPLPCTGLYGHVYGHVIIIDAIIIDMPGRSFDIAYHDVHVTTTKMAQ